MPTPTNTIDKPTSVEMTRAKLLWLTQRWQRDIVEIERPMTPADMTRRERATYRCPYTTTDARSLREISLTLNDLADEIDDQNAVPNA
jgi:hypothetical protein